MWWTLGCRSPTDMTVAMTLKLKQSFSPLGLAHGEICKDLTLLFSPPFLKDFEARFQKSVFFSVKHRTSCVCILSGTYSF